jgi:hypothetical protein
VSERGSPEENLVGVVEELTDHGVAEVAVGLLHQEEVEELTLGAEHGQVVLGPACSLDMASMGVEGAGDSEMVEREVAQSDVLLELGGVRDPLAETLGHHQVVVGVSQQSGDARVECWLGCPVGSAARHVPRHIWPTSSGIS